jgi:hypothetical protein
MKAAIYIEQKSKKTGEIMPWAGYIYADEEVNKNDFTYIKDSKDQWGKDVKVYQAAQSSHLETPGGIESTDLVVLF